MISIKKLLLSYGQTSPVWTSSALMTSSRGYLAGNGSPEAAMAIGGASNTTESFNGSSWSAEGNMITSGRYRNAAAGTPTAALTWTGGTSSSSTSISNTTESYNGSSWSSENNYVASLNDVGYCGVDTSAVGYGGHTGSAPVAYGRLYNGTSWLSIDSPGSSNRHPALCGYSTGAVSAGGQNSTPSYINNTYKYNGSTWSSSGNLLYDMGYAAAAGDDTQALFFGGTGSGSSGLTMSFNGSVWSMRDNMATGRRSHGGSNSSGTNAMAFGNNSATTSTEIYN